MADHPTINGETCRDSNTATSAVVLPKYGWKVKLNHEFSERRNQFIKPRLHQLPHFVGLGTRYLAYYIKLRRQKRKPVMDGIKPIPLQQIYGVPMGGIGSGTIGRGFKGEFCRFQMFPGCYHFRVVKANQFIVCIRKNNETVYQQVLSPHKAGKKLSAWKWQYDGSCAEYVGLYPRSWTAFDLPGQNVRIVCRQVSPVIPHNYKDSCLPATVFVWTLENNSDDDLDISIVLTFKSGVGSKKDRSGGHWSEPFTNEEGSEVVKGVMLHMQEKRNDCTYAIAGLEKDGCHVSYLTSFDPCGSGQALWDDLVADGRLESSNDASPKTLKGKELACAVCIQKTIVAKSKGDVELSVVWDMPKVVFQCSPNSTNFQRRYCRWFGCDGNASPKMTSYALNNYQQWEEAIEKWQNPILQDSTLPDWYKSALFNELYFVSDGGSLWIEMPSTEGSMAVLGDVRPEYGRFAYLEGHEYRMYNTYDVHFYASIVLIMLWPKLQFSLQYDIAEYAITEDSRRTKYLFNGIVGVRKTENSVPHDIGDPDEAPWELGNSYIMNDSAKWKDLNVKFVLQVYRDYVLTKDENYLRFMWPKIQALMTNMLQWDSDGDGLIEHSGQPDQTYDTWVMKGPSAYCGGLWLAALFAMSQMATKLGLQDVKYSEMLQRGKQAYEDKLWNGTYFKFDCNRGSHSNTIMADQLCGHWYLGMCGHKHEVFDKEKVNSVFRTIFDYNVMRFKGGSMGAVNGMLPSGKIDLYTVQSEEAWVGVTYALAAAMIQEGMVSEGLHTAEGMFNTLYYRLGMAYQTPEAICAENTFRSSGYMRPLSIWAIQWALMHQRQNMPS